ncbi:hypothetical protein CCOS865_04373 [Pseudomonas reidholzensis]|uniref:Knr4/Smi1-like domain-containing protein n=1 Tax=Pseudomonas reidholzensis TaxID=1785162 RepID=A0A383S0D0_9PSED|nr:SMI1/KNR4 family protein [Pseudomonas reidholzensis]SYX92088.1 hypothetical protein CCOS865_04373 [Pseudomonas reidholzensis]
MNLYKALKDGSGDHRPLRKLEVVAPAALAQLASSYPALPSDYSVFLETVGSGEIGQAAFMLYDGLLTAEQIYDKQTAAGLAGVLLFGDDMQGYCVGFDSGKGWAVVEVDPLNGQAHEVAGGFETYLRELLSSL